MTVLFSWEGTFNPLLDSEIWRKALVFQADGFSVRKFYKRVLLLSLCNQMYQCYLHFNTTDLPGQELEMGPGMLQLMNGDHVLLVEPVTLPECMFWNDASQSAVNINICGQLHSRYIYIILQTDYYYYFKGPNGWKMMEYYIGEELLL